MFDIVCSVGGIILLSPLFLWASWRIKKEDGGPIFYRGERVGINGRLFRIFKFRSMVINAEKIGASSTSEDDQRITKVGKLLRKYKIDELPQLINVLTGDMSFVGPRPQVKWAVDLYSSEEKEILTVRPGITDYASIKFSNEEEILKGSDDPDKTYMEIIHPGKTRLNLDYIKNRSFFNDFKIIFQTLKVILKKGLECKNAQV